MAQKIADETAPRILRELLNDARITNNELAERAGLEHYERFIKEKIARLKCVDTIETSFVMNTIKQRRF